MMRFSFGFLLLFVPLVASAVNVERTTTFFQRHKDWISVGFAEASFERVIVARAASEDARTAATLTIDFLVNNRCATDIQLVYKMDSPVSEPILQQPTYGLMQVDNRDPLYVNGSLNASVGDKFLFLTLHLADKEIQKIKAARSIVFNMHHHRIATFSLSGFNNAYSKAKKLCSHFMLSPKREKPTLHFPLARSTPP